MFDVEVTCVATLPPGGRVGKGWVVKYISQSDSRVYSVSSLNISHSNKGETECYILTAAVIGLYTSLSWIQNADKPAHSSLNPSCYFFILEIVKTE